ncbi:MAG: hypothetical protein WA919_05395 [Coleofasciculaceae cyanobacterium]
MDTSSSNPQLLYRCFQKLSVKTLLELIKECQWFINEQGIDRAEYLASCKGEFDPVEQELMNELENKRIELAEVRANLLMGLLVENNYSACREWLEHWEKQDSLPVEKICTN